MSQGSENHGRRRFWLLIARLKNRIFRATTDTGILTLEGASSIRGLALNDESSSPPQQAEPTEIETETETSASPGPDPSLNDDILQSSPCIELPAEVLECILRSVSTKTTLRNLALCCRRFHQVIGPQLFRSIYVSFDCDDLGDKAAKRDVRNLILYLLIHPRNFAHLVKHIRLRGPESRHGNSARVRSLCRYRELDLELKTAATSYVTASYNASTKLVRTGVKGLNFMFGDPVTQSVLLLALLPQTETFHLQTPVERILANETLRLNVFSDLQTITLEWMLSKTSPSSTCLRGYYFQQLVHAPSLQKVCLIRYASDTFSFHWEPPIRKLSLKCLELRESSLARRDHFFHLLIPSLHKFVYEQMWMPGVHQDLFGPDSMMRALGKKSGLILESLWMNFTRDLRPRPRELRLSFDKQALRQLPQLENLRHLCFPLEFMLGDLRHGMCRKSVDDLPVSLETLVLISHKNGWTSPVSAFLNDFSRLLFEDRTEPYQNSPQEILPCLRRMVVIAAHEHLLYSLPSTLIRLEQIPDLEVILAIPANQINYSCLENKRCTERIREIEDLMGLTRLGSPRWIGVNIAALKGQCASRYDIDDESE